MKFNAGIALIITASAALTTTILMVASPALRISTCGNAEQHLNRALMELRITTNNPVSVALWNCSVSL